MSCKLTIDFSEEVPIAGDVLVSSGGSGYLVIGLSKVNSAKHTNRWKINCARINPHTDPAISDGTRFFSFNWYSRSRQSDRRNQQLSL